MKGASNRPGTTGPPLAAVVGHPIAHSLSPRVFALLSGELRLPVRYSAIDIAPEDLSQRLQAESRAGNFTGWNVTLPHKKAVLNMADRIHPEAGLVGAANVLHFTPEGIEAHNTDVFGVEQTLREQRFDASAGPAMLLGAGGAARAVACALGRAAVSEVLVWNRTCSAATSLCADMSASFPATSFRPVDVAHEFNRRLGLLVNATSVGLPGHAGPLPCPPLEQGGLALDLVYGAEPTGFLRNAARAGMRTVDGLDMLLWQAVATWEIWFGAVAHPAELKLFLKKNLWEEA